MRAASSSTSPLPFTGGKACSGGADPREHRLVRGQGGAGEALALLMEGPDQAAASPDPAAACGAELCGVGSMERGAAAQGSAAWGSAARRMGSVGLWMGSPGLSIGFSFF